VSNPDQSPHTQATPISAKPAVLVHLPVILLALVCGLVFYEAATTLTEQGYASGTPISNAALYPRLLAGLLLFLLSLQLINDLRGKAGAAQSDGPAADGTSAQTVLVGLAIVAYVVLLPIVGFILATPILVLGMLALLGDRQIATLIGVPIVITVGCMLVFQGLFNVNLPRGLFGIALNF